MKKLTITLLAIVMAFAFAACSSNEPAAEKNEIADLYVNEEYSSCMSSCTEGVWKGVFQKDDFAEVILAEAKFSKEEAKAYDAIDFADEEAEDKQLDIVLHATDVTITDVTDKVPTQEDLDAKWIGKKCADLEDAGFYESGNTSDEEEGLRIFYDGPDYCVELWFKNSKELSIDDLSANDIRALKIIKVKLTGLGDSFID
ncbi:MAG: hypothetical protein KBS56_06020 [Clostridiales bacterium]|nr:hypothetical protein [Candidatus Crickella equi]